MPIKTVELFTNNLWETEAFYAGVLQLAVLSRVEDSITFQIGYSTLTFNATQDRIGIYHFAFLLPKNKVDEGYAWLKSRTPVLPFDAEGDIAQFTNWNAQAVYFHDPFQNIIELIAHHDLPQTWDDAFSANALLGIAEMGLVVADVTAACQVLHQKYGVPYFSKGPYFKDFAVMGEEDALLILSAAGRGWLPTGQPAEPCPVNVTLQVDEKEINIHLNGNDLA